VFLKDGGRAGPSTARGAGNVCYAFQKEGVCPNGDKCQFLHEVVEPNAEDNMGSGLVEFVDEAGMRAALSQGSLHVSRKTVCFYVPAPARSCLGALGRIDTY
jgi:hypothetical protein